MSRILTIVDHGGNQLDVLDIRGTATCTTELVDRLRAALAPYGSAKELSGPPTPHAGALDMSGVDPRRLAALSEAVRLASDSPDLTSIQAARFLLGEDGASDG